MQPNHLSDEEVQKQVSKFDPEFSFKDLTGKAALVTAILSVILSLFHIYTAGFGVLLAMKHRAVHLTLVLTLVFLLFPAKKSGKSKSIGTIPLDILSFSIIYVMMGLYLLYQYQDA